MVDTSVGLAGLALEDGTVGTVAEAATNAGDLALRLADKTGLLAATLDLREVGLGDDTGVGLSW